LSQHEIIFALVFLTSFLGLVVLWVLSSWNKIKEKMKASVVELDKAELMIASQRELLLDPCLYKAITHRYNNIRGGDRFQCMKLKEELQRLRNEQ